MEIIGLFLLFFVITFFIYALSNFSLINNQTSWLAREISEVLLTEKDFCERFFVSTKGCDIFIWKEGEEKIWKEGEKKEPVLKLRGSTKKTESIFFVEVIQITDPHWASKLKVLLEEKKGFFVTGI